MDASKIIYNRRVSDCHFVMGLAWTAPTPVVPGQFVMLRVSRGYDPLLRRPFGIFDYCFDIKGDAPADTLEIIYKVVGKGTTIMSELKPGDNVDILGPLGNGFPEPPRSSELVMVAGGIGIAPFKLIAEKHRDALLIFGARDSLEASLVDDIENLGLRVKVATEDGSRGTKGLVTDLLKDEISKRSVVFSCGPLGMLKAVSLAAREKRVDSFVSLERSMACGLGACLGCAVKTGAKGAKKIDRVEFSDYKMVCSDGPVFNSQEIDWERL